MRAHRRQVKRLAALYPGYRVEVRRVSNRTPGYYIVPPRWRVYLVQTDVVRRVIGEGARRAEALRNALDETEVRRWL